ncbi:nuclear pore complex subunit Nro1-domain-containing protein [Sporodiniella umbellata]|nr:nuclear pore complex subunit Nro1-domain-containing protein [Sporodiniella umbellata]
MAQKRARGLKKSAADKASKKTKVEGDSDLPENTQTILIEKEVEEGDEMGEMIALLEMAMEKLETNPEEAIALLRGTIHSSDQILRTATSDLPAIFFYSYGLALYELGQLEDGDDFDAFMEAAEERLQEGLELKDETLQKKIQLALCKVWFSQAAALTAENDTIAIRSLEALKELDLDTKERLQWSDIVQQQGASFYDLATRNKFLAWSEKTLEPILKDDPSHPQANHVLGLCKLHVAHYWLDKAPEEEEEEEGNESAKTELSQEEQEAYKFILKSKTFFELAEKQFVERDSLGPQILADLGEIYLNEANLVLDADEQNAIYDKATGVIKRAQKLIEEKQLNYELPEILVDFIEEQ